MHEKHSKYSVTKLFRDDWTEVNSVSAISKSCNLSGTRGFDEMEIVRKARGLWKAKFSLLEMENFH